MVWQFEASEMKSNNIAKGGVDYIIIWIYLRAQESQGLPTGRLMIRSIFLNLDGEWGALGKKHAA